MKEENKKLNICLVAPLPPPCGGITNWTKMLCNYLDNEMKEEIQYTVINISPKIPAIKRKGIWQKVVISGIEMIKIIKQLKHQIRLQRFNCVHITTSGGMSFIRDFLICDLLNKYEIPIIYHLHFGKLPELSKNRGVKWKWIIKILKKTKKIIAIDKDTYEYLFSFCREKVVYIPNPLDMREMPGPNIKNEKRVVFIGWVIKEKGIEELLEAWSKIRTFHEEWILDIIGPYNEEYYHYLKLNYDTQNVVFWGEKSHEKTMEMLNKAEIFVLPSYTEGCPYVILEAMALQKAIIATKVGDIPEMLVNGCGILIEPRNIKEVEKKLKSLIDNNTKCERLGEKASIRLREEYLMDKIIRKYKKEWEAII